jgi:hypothetical protein
VGICEPAHAEHPFGDAVIRRASRRERRLWPQRKRPNLYFYAAIAEVNSRVTARLAAAEAAAGDERASQRRASAEAAAGRLAARWAMLEQADAMHEHTGERRGRAADALAGLSSRGRRMP